MKRVSFILSFFSCGIILLTVGCFVFYLANNEYDFPIILEAAKSPHLLPTIYKSFWVALCVAAITTLASASMAQVISKAKYQNLLLSVVIFQLLLSPYIFTQGWIFWFGENGFINGNLFSAGGLIFLLFSQNLPWGIIICTLLFQPINKGQRDLSRLLGWGAWKKIYLITIPRFQLGLQLCFLWTFFQAFWAYDVSSMLRQNIISLEIMAAFGSFYDLNQALGIILPTAPLLIILTFFFLAPLKNWRTFNLRSGIESENPSQTKFIFSLTIIVVLTMIPTIGIIKQLPEINTLLQTFTGYQSDFWNTVFYSFFAAGFCTLICFSLPNKRPILYLITPLLLVIFCIPSTIHGIIWISILNSTPLWFPDKFKVICVLSYLLLPLCFILKWGLFRRNHPSTCDFLKLANSRSRLLVLRDVNRPKIGLLLLILILIGSKEVPAVLLIYPAGGSTLALTIETMLHFDQPELVSSLALLQMIFTILVFLFIRLTFGRLI